MNSRRLISDRWMPEPQIPKDGVIFTSYEILEKTRTYCLEGSTHKRLLLETQFIMYDSSAFSFPSAFCARRLEERHIMLIAYRACFLNTRLAPVKDYFTKLLFRPLSYIRHLRKLNIFCPKRKKQKYEVKSDVKQGKDNISMFSPY